MEMKWSPMVVVSALFHLAIFATLLFVPESLPTTRFYDGVVYEVDLVELPAGEAPKEASRTVSKSKKAAKTVTKKETTAKRIQPVKKKEKPLVIAKRTVDKPTSSVKKPKLSGSELIDRAVSKIEREVKSEEHVDKAISKLEDELSEPSEPAPSPRPRRSRSFGGVGGTAIQIYQMEVEGWVKSNWSYPVAMDSAKDLEAIVVVTVKRDGTILETRFEKESSSGIFNQSVLKAIERSDPLPPFPESYRKDHDEIEIHFNLKELEDA